jgi:NTE family protein
VAEHSAPIKAASIRLWPRLASIRIGYVQTLKQEADDKVCNIVQLIYNCKSYEGIAKDFEFSRRTMEEHWRDGYNDAVRALGHRKVLELPDRAEGVRTFDFTEVRSN